MVRIQSFHLLTYWVNQARSFSDLVILDCFGIFTYSFHIYTDRAHLAGLGNVDPILVNAFDNNLSEVPILVWSKHHHLVQLNNAFQDSTTQNETDTF